VFFIIMPNQRVVVADLKAGRKPDPKYGKIAKQRSTHNNYLTLPVIFLMLSNHYPLVFATEYNWIIASLVFLMGVTIRHWFNTQHARKGNPHWTWAATAILFLLIAWLSTAPVQTRDPESAMAPGALRYAAATGFDDARPLLDVPRGRAGLGGPPLPAQRRGLGNPRPNRRRGEADLPASRPQPRHAAREPQLHGARRTRGHHPVVPIGRAGWHRRLTQAGLQPDSPPELTISPPVPCRDGCQTQTRREPDGYQTLMFAENQRLNQFSAPVVTAQGKTPRFHG
jgi:hypothetical protein